MDTTSGKPRTESQKTVKDSLCHGVMDKSQVHTCRDFMSLNNGKPYLNTGYFLPSSTHINGGKNGDLIKRTLRYRSTLKSHLLEDSISLPNKN